MPEKNSTLTTEYTEKVEERIFQIPSLEDRVKISGKIALGSDEESTNPQCPGSQCFSLCCRC